MQLLARPLNRAMRKVTLKAGRSIWRKFAISTHGLVDACTRILSTISLVAYRIANRFRRLSWIENLRGSLGNQQFVSLRCALTSAQSVQNMSGCLDIRRESCKIEWRDAAGPIEPKSTLSRNGKECTKQKRSSTDCNIRQESSAGARRNDIISPTNNPS